MFKSIKAGASRNAVSVFGVWEGTKTVPRGLREDSDDIGELLQRPGFKGGSGQLVANENALLVGLGKRGELDRDSLRTIGCTLVRSLDRMAFNSASIELSRTIPVGVATAEDIGQLVAEGAMIGNWRVDFFDGAASENKPAKTSLRLTSSDKDVLHGLKRGVLLGEAVNYARRIATTPPNICNPPWVAKECRRMARSAGLRCRVITYTEAKRLGMGGLVNVGKGSDAKPCMIILEYRPKRSDRTLCFVGKTVTYDTGGYSLKVNNGMKGMKYDKNGGMAVLGAMKAIAALNPPVRVVGVLACAENMVSGDAYRPDDIITMYNGVSVEVTNTDAEGRLVLADALAWSCKQIKPDAIVDLATLTGGVVVALGSASAGLWCSDKALRRDVFAAADESGERAWRLPLWKEHRQQMRSKHADILNSSASREAHPIQGAAFLSYFVDDDVPWAHIDIAGVSAVESDRGMFVTGPTGWGVRLLTALAVDSQ